MLDDADRTARDDRGAPALNRRTRTSSSVHPTGYPIEGSARNDAIHRFERGYEIQRGDAPTGERLVVRLAQKREQVRNLREYCQQNRPPSKS
jgi:hypothetical protein